MSYSSLAIANHLLRASKVYGKPLDNLKLQKLLYFAHGWWYALKDEQLLDEAIQAWVWGPVVQRVYNEFKQCGSGDIDGRAREWNGEVARLARTEEADEVRTFLEAVAWMYRNSSGMELAKETHATGTPWRQVYERRNGLSYFEQIPEESIRLYFRHESRATQVERVKKLISQIRGDEE